MNLSHHFTLEEMTRSDYAIRNGIDNTPPHFVVDNLMLLCSRILEPLRDMFGVPIIISSGYRSELVNRGIGGSPTSDHCKGLAADFEIPGVSNYKVCEHIAGTNLHFGQLIYEFGEAGWVHISYDAAAKRQVLEARKVHGRTVYLPLEFPSAPGDRLDG